MLEVARWRLSKAASSDGNPETHHLHHHPAWIRRNHHGRVQRVGHARLPRIRSDDNRGGHDMRTVG